MLFQLLCATFISLSLITDADNHLGILMSALREVFYWIELGLQLKVPLYRLREIQVEKPTVRERILEVLDCWLKGGNEHSKTFLKRALKKMGWNVEDCSKPNETGELIMSSSFNYSLH